MIVVNLIGGLGNQLFQYAAARRLALLRNVPLKLDITPFNSYKLHKYSLMHYRIEQNFATIDDLSSLLSRGAVLREDRLFEFNPQLFQMPGYTYLQGYFQSHRYFKDIESVIRHDITVTSPVGGQDAVVLGRINRTNAINLHVRRADYVNDSKTNSVHGICSPRYYAAALEHVRARVADPVLFVFSDDIYWAQENLHFDLPTVFVGHNNADRNFEDLRLMASCRHHIIANSSYSWWGAWLAGAPDKIVCAPARWMAVEFDKHDLLPETWAVIDA